MEHSRQADRDRTLQIARIALFIGVGVLFLAIMQPFFSAIAWAVVVCYALFPLYRRLVRITGGRETISALLMCTGVTLGLIFPLLYLSFLLGEELTKTYRSLAQLVEQRETLLSEGMQNLPLVAAVGERIEEYERLSGTDLRTVFANNLSEIGSWLVNQLTQVATNLLLGLFQLGLILICAFFFFRDGLSLVNWLQDVIPFKRERQQMVIQRFDEVVTGSIYGNVLVAVLEGATGGLAFFAVGLPWPIIWGTVMGLLAFLPLVGAGMIWIPAALYLLYQGLYGKMAILCIAGGIIGFIDYGVRNIIVGKHSKLHPILVLFSVLGGIALFGLVGIVAGPLVVAVGMTMIEISRSEQTARLQPSASDAPS
ncbi:MAG: AI-2E family transporter [Nitrospiraceae bacterium]